MATHVNVAELEQQVLGEYSRLISNLDSLSNTLGDLAESSCPEMLDSLRVLERKTATVFTLLKASVYSIVLQQGVEQ